MFTRTTLQIRDHNHQPLPNTFLKQDWNADHLVLVFPGLNYSADLPAVYYPTQLLADHGFDVLRVEYRYGVDPSFEAASGDERSRRIRVDALAAGRAGLEQRQYNQVTLVGKSIGTLAMGHLLEEKAFQQADCIWLTPILSNAQLRSQIQRARPRSLFVIGTEDQFYDEARLSELEISTHGKSVVIPKADHSLEIRGKTLDSLRAMEDVLSALEAFVNEKLA